MNYLFFVGNKRCGTSLMVNLLNLHPNIFVSHESDIIWILNWFEKRSRNPVFHPWDDGLGMGITLKECAHILSELDEPENLFCAITMYLMKHGSEIHRTYEKTDILWLGDKKPVQCGDPDVRQFLKQYFPNSKFLHMVRDPVACVASKMEAAKRAITAGDTRGLPDYWRGTPITILDRWVVHEDWALRVEEEFPTLRVLLEDLYYAPVFVMEKVFRFLDLEMSDRIEEQIRCMVSPAQNVKYDSSKYDMIRLELSNYPLALALVKEYYG